MSIEYEQDLQAEIEALSADRQALRRANARIRQENEFLRSKLDEMGFNWSALLDEEDKMEFDRWWELNERYCEGQPARYIALSAWCHLKDYHRIPSVTAPALALNLDGNYFCSCELFEADPDITAVVCKHCGKPPTRR